MMAEYIGGKKIGLKAARLRDVGPIFATDNPAHSGPVYLVLARKEGYCGPPLGMSLSSGPDVLNGQLRTLEPLSARLAALGNLVINVVLIGALKQMARAAAGRIVATWAVVAPEVSWTYGATELLLKDERMHLNQTTGAVSPTAYPEMTVSKMVAVAHEGPATSRGCPVVNHRPGSNGGRNARLTTHRESPVLGVAGPAVTSSAVLSFYHFPPKGHRFTTHDGRVYEWQESWSASAELP